MSRILVIGGSSGTGLACVKEALGRDHEVRMFSRSATRSDLTHERLEKFDADALDSNCVANALNDIDIVLQALGVPFDLKMLTGPVTLFSKSTQVLIPAMQNAGVKRLIALTGFGSGDCYSAVSGLQRPGFKLVFGRAYDDKSIQEQLIQASDLDWTFARPGVLRNGERTGNYKILTQADQWRNGVIRRANVADFMVGAAESGEYVKQGPVLIEHGLLPFT